MRLSAPKIPVKTASQLDKMRDAGKLLEEVFEIVAETVKPGATTGDIDRAAREAIEKRGAVPSFLGYPSATGAGPFTGSVCSSVNEVLVHGIPSDKVVLAEGDIISVDIGLRRKGWHSDRSTTFAVGAIDEESRRLMDVTELAFWASVGKLRGGARIGEYQHVSQRVVEGAGMHVVDKYCSHGIGQNLHEEPQIINKGRASGGFRLKAGMVFALEPMVGLGTSKTRELKDGWTVVMKDGRRCAHYEHTVAIGADGPEILTLNREESERRLAQAAEQWASMESAAAAKKA